MLIYLIFLAASLSRLSADKAGHLQTSDYWAQSIWDGGPGQLMWEDTTRYLNTLNIDGRIFPGEIRLFAPSGNWESSVELDIWRVNTIIADTGGIIYAGCSYDSSMVLKSRLVKLKDYGNSFVWEKTLGGSDVYSLFLLKNGNLLAGAGTYLYIFPDAELEPVYIKSFSGNILSLYQPWDFNYVYLGTSAGQIWYSNKNGAQGTWEKCPGLPYQAGSINQIFESSNKIFYACTGPGYGGKVFWSVEKEGIYWDLLKSFSGIDAIYSICEDPSHNLYISGVSNDGSGKLYTSSDSGKSWQTINSPWEEADFYHILADSNGSLYVGGWCRGAKAPKGMIFTSKDKGETWDTLYKPQGVCPSYIKALYQTREGILLTGGDTNVVLRSGYSTTGWLESSVYDVFENASRVNRSLQFKRLHWDGNLNGGNIKIKERSGLLDSIPDSMLGWDRCYPVPQDGNPVDYNGAFDGDRYIQYRVELSSSSSIKTPVVSLIYTKFTYDTTCPYIVSAIASDGDSALPGIDDDDYVDIKFSESMNASRIETRNIDKALKLSQGHSWRSDSGRGVIKRTGEWVTPSILRIYLSTLRIGDGAGYPPTIEIGDTITPDSTIIQDVWDNPCFSPCVITGSFSKTGTEESRKWEVGSGKLKIYPNPFSTKTVISYSSLVISEKNLNDQLPMTNNLQHVVLRIYDLSGRLIKTLVNENKSPSTYKFKLHKDSLKSGIYFLKLTVDNKTIDTQKLILLK
ncbi:T9SS type A sorting domain-containing protein [candidate division WOR-3 bacterium]|nr:T9SS type A sorting domain-containing protein [candidate division WOR-3 bacterium]